MVATTVAQSDRDSVTDWLAIYHAPGVGGATFHNLLDHFGSPANILQGSAGQLRSLGLTQAAVDALRQPGEEALARDLDWLALPDNHIITCRSDAWPVLLSQLPDPPPLLYVHGDVSLLAEPQLAMVGSRNPTASGKQTATDFARHLASAGLVITSGLALGIDAASHQGALDANCPTIALTGNGLDRVYPASHRDLAHAIGERGALVSEFPVGTPPLAENFPRRNRLISGLSLGTLVVEAALRSGSLITARYAAEQGREVFAIPGSIHNPLARGCHHLIRQGAKLVETAADVIEELGALAGACRALVTETPAEQPDKLAAEYMQLLELIGFDDTSVDRLVNNSGLTPAEVSSMLLQLELDGYIAASHGGQYNRLK
jgi:DNA processing protein